MNQRGVLHLLPLFLIAVLVGAGILLYLGIIKLPFLPSLPSLPFGQKGPKVELKTEYKNPFKKETQFVNPFDTYKNPFVTNR